MGCWQNAGEGFPILRPARFSEANLQAPLQFRVFDVAARMAKLLWRPGAVHSWLRAWAAGGSLRGRAISAESNLSHSRVALLANSGTSPFVSRKFVARLDARKTLFLLSKYMLIRLASRAGLKP